MPFMQDGKKKKRGNVLASIVCPVRRDRGGKSRHRPLRIPSKKKEGIGVSMTLAAWGSPRICGRKGKPPSSLLPQQKGKGDAYFPRRCLRSVRRGGPGKKKNQRIASNSGERKRKGGEKGANPYSSSVPRLEGEEEGKRRHTWEGKRKDVYPLCRLDRLKRMKKIKDSVLNPFLVDLDRNRRRAP